jgi:hypothetical protein
MTLDRQAWRSMNDRIKWRRHKLSAPFLVAKSIEFLNRSGFVPSELVKETSGTVKDLSLEVGMLEITGDDALPIARCCC